jgi:hypothetical protein
LFHFTTEAEFNTKIAALKTKIDHLTDYQMVVELSKISASIGDAHTYIHTDRLLQHWLPLKIGVFEEGFYVLSAMTGYEDLFGGRIVGFDNKSIRVAVS